MPGIYVVTHRNTAHDAPHLVLILEQIVLPKGNHCRDVFFTLDRPLIELIYDCEFFGREMAGRPCWQNMELFERAQISYDWGELPAPPTFEEIKPNTEPSPPIVERS